MGKNRPNRGAPKAYAHGGQSSKATVKCVPRKNEASLVYEEFRNKPEIARRAFPRLSWAQVVERGGWITQTYPLSMADRQVVDRLQLLCIPAEVKHQAALALYDCRAPVECVRAAVEGAWTAVSSLFMALAGDEAYDIFRYCQFEVPPEYGSVFPVWRGVRGVSLEVGRAGHCWTLNRNWAVNWAMTDGPNKTVGAPLVIRRVIQTRNVIFWSNQYDEAEVVVDAVPDGAVDGTPEEWGLTSRRFKNQLSMREFGRRVEQGDVSPWH